MTRKRLYANLTEEDLKRLDIVREALDYQNRTDFVTAIILTIIDSDNAYKAIKNIKTVIETTNQEKEVFFDILNEYAFPLISIQGTDYAYKTLKDDLHTWMYERCRYIPTDKEAEKWMKEYAAVRNKDIRTHRNNIMIAKYEEEHGIAG